MITWIIAVPIIAYGAYWLIRSVKQEVKGGGCSGCSCDCSSSNDCPSQKY